MIHTVIFDIDNTMYSFDRAHGKAMEALFEYGSSAFSMDSETMSERLGQSQKKILGRLGNNSSAIHNRLIRFQTFLEEMGNMDLTKAIEMYHIYWDTLLDVMEPEPGIIELVRDLRKRGITVGIGSDMTAYIQYQKLKKLGVLEEISFIVTSEEAGAEKPSRDFFRICVEKAGCIPGNCAFIGDGLKKDVEGATENGLVGIWYCPNGNKIKNKGRYPMITSYLECVKQGKIILE